MNIILQNYKKVIDKITITSLYDTNDYIITY